MIIQNFSKLISTILLDFQFQVAGGDWGAYLDWDESIQFDYLTLVAAGLMFMSFRGDQEQLDEYYGNYSTLRNLAAARAAGVLVNGCYYWLYPHAPQAYYLDRYKRAIERERPDFIEVDAEDTHYFAPDGSLCAVDPSRTADSLLELCDGLIAAFPEIPFLLYTRPSWVYEYAPAALAYVDRYDHHSAGWPDYGLEIYDVPLQEALAGRMKQVLSYDVKPYPWRWVNVVTDGFTPPQITPKSRVRIWQSSSRVRYTYSGKTARASHQYDTNFWMGDRASLLAWAKKKPAAPPAPPQNPVFLPFLSR